MADPVIVACAADSWTKVATNVTSGFVHIKQRSAGVSFQQTYRLTGTAAPTDLTDAIPFKRPMEEISASVAIDVYIYAQNGAGSVRVDL